MTVMNPQHTGTTTPGGDLLACLLLVAQAHQISATAESLTAGLPLEHQQLTPSLFHRAARRAGLSSKVLQRDLQHLNPALFPAILLLNNNQACLLLSLDNIRATARVVFPDLADAPVDMALADLTERYAGSVIYARPQERFDTRATDIAKPHQGHWFWGVISAHKYLYRDVLLTALMINFFALVAPLFVMNVYDRVVPNQATDTLWVLSLGVLIAISADFVLRMMRTWFVDLAASRVDVTLSASIMERVLGMKLSERPASVGSFAAGLTSFESIRSFIGSATILSLVDLPFVLLFLLVVLLIAWPLAIPILVGIILMVIYTAAVQHKMHLLSENAMQAGAQRNATLVESLTGLETLKTLGAEGRMQAIWEKSTLLVSRVGVKMRLLSGSVASGTLWLQQAVSVVIIIVGVYQIIDGNLTQGGLIAAYMLSGRVLGPIAQTAGLLMQYHSASTALESLNQVMAKPVERPADAQWISRPRLQGAIEFNNVNFKYPQDDRDILRGVSFRLEPGERVAILGRNGSGKSTLEKLIAGLYEPSSGRLLIDHIDSRQLDPAELRRNIGYVSQDVNLFFGTLRDNILMGSPQAEDTALWEAIRLSGLTEFVNNHPMGLAMPVGEHGQLLSGGQRQSVTVARALLKDPNILLLDEPTGAMDHSSEEEFKRNMAQYAQGKTMVVITHRTSLLELVNRIIVIDAGKIVADGPKEQVVEALRQGRIGRAN
ncbi:type I secretion system permease/ATPase [Cellvibrio japonicus]|uniref:Toxin secretion ATP-binding protein n=1 Tax=Cellvibrio japonicus (strain Ueda107) TaxID=498211 RepID=B3PD28_CELJU|nr:type I secretion system permease/ATPase [Cellvibrio japonicus]ACE86350.1 toxin secretion ATP-binding protein [Cellvibrio japonicus Ueda107]